MKKKLLIIIGILVLFIVGSVIIFLLNKTELKDTSWKLDSWYLSSKSIDKNDITLTFLENSVSGNGGVNSYGADYTEGPKNKLLITNVISTEMASTDPEVNEVESTYFRLLTEVKYYKISVNKLFLYNEDEKVILTFVK